MKKLLLLTLSIIALSGCANNNGSNEKNDALYNYVYEKQCQRQTSPQLYFKIFELNCSAKDNKNRNGHYCYVYEVDWILSGMSQTKQDILYYCLANAKEAYTVIVDSDILSWEN